MGHRTIVVSDFIAIRVPIAQIGSTIDLEGVDLPRRKKVYAAASSNKIRLRRSAFDAHCYRASDLRASKNSDRANRGDDLVMDIAKGSPPNWLFASNRLAFYPTCKDAHLAHVQIRTTQRFIASDQ